MSTEQLDLAGSIERYEESQSTEAPGRGADNAEDVTLTRDTRPMCLGCEGGRLLVDVVGSASRARQIARVVGDNEGHIPACADCIDLNSGMQVESTVRAAQLARGGRS